jgi:hypothetical protein
MHGNQSSKRGAYLWLAGAVGAAAGIAAIAMKRRRQTPWEKVRRRAGRVAGQCRDAVKPWGTLATTAAVTAISLARRWERRRAAADIAKTGTRLLRRVQQLSGETSKLYPSVKKLMA